MKEFLISLLSKTGLISAKRFWGSVLLIMLCFSYIYCTIKVVRMPETTDAFLTLAGVLLGIEAVVSPFSKNNKKED